jgi:hypothetical protein
MKKIIVINGYPESGKDEFVNIFRSVVPDWLLISNYSTIDLYKDIARTFLGWDGKDKSDKLRELLSSLKAIHSRYDDGPFENACNWISNVSVCSNNCVVFIHSREPDEIKRFKEKYGEICYTLLIERQSAKPANNSSDLSVKMTDYDYVIENNGTLEDLEEKAKRFYEWLDDKSSHETLAC